MGLNAGSHIDNFDVGESLVLTQCLVILFVPRNSLLEIILCLLTGHGHVVKPMHFYFLDVVGNNVGVVADGLYPNELIFLLHALLEYLPHTLSALCCGISAIQNSHYVVRFVDVVNQIIDRHRCDLLPQV